VYLGRDPVSGRKSYATRSVRGPRREPSGSCGRWWRRPRPARPIERAPRSGSCARPGCPMPAPIRPGLRSSA